MSVFLLYIIAIFAIIPTKADLPYGWTDPNDMGAPSDYYKYSGEAQNHDSPQKAPNCQMFEQYFRRTINMLLNSVHEQAIETDFYSGHLFLKFEREKFEILSDFANDRRHFELAQIDEILSGVLSKPTHEHLQEYLETYFHRFLSFVLNREAILSIMALTYCIIVYKLFHAKFYAWNIAKFLLINLFLLDFVFTTISMYQNAQIKKMSDLSKYKSMPYECDPEKMNSLQFILKYFRSEDECAKYHEILYKDPFWSISPLSVFGEMFSNLIHRPAIAIGEGFGNISSKIFHSFPYPINFLMFPIIMIFFCIFTLIILSFALNIPIKLNFLHLFSISFGDKPKTHTQNMISEHTVNKILDIAAPRKFIEELPVDTAEPNSPAHKTNSKKLKNLSIKDNNATVGSEKSASDSQKPTSRTQTKPANSESYSKEVNPELIDGVDSKTNTNESKIECLDPDQSCEDVTHSLLPTCNKK